MKIQELRDLLITADKTHLEKVSAELYKMLAKIKKGEADQRIADILADKDLSVKEKTETLIDFDNCKCEIQTFIENAYAQNYLAPNRIVPKNQRPKWRFMVKNFVKVLEKIPAENPDCADAAILLKELYKMLCIACNFYLFSTEDPFRSVGIRQTDLCQIILTKTFSLGYTRESIREMIQLVTMGGLDRETVHDELEVLLPRVLKTSDTKYIAIEEAKVLINESEEKLSGPPKRNSDKYHIYKDIGELCKMIIILGIELGEAEEEIKYHFQHYKGYTSDAPLYAALSIADLMEDERIWLWTYEYGIETGFNPEEKLQRQYQTLRKNSIA